MATIFSGVPAGAIMPYQFSIKRSGMPTSAVVATSGAVGARRRAKRDWAQCAGLDVRQEHRQVEERHLHLLSQQIVDGRCRAAIRHVHDVDLRGQFEQLTGQVRQAADAGGGKIEFARLRLC